MQPPVNASLITTFASGHGWVVNSNNPPATFVGDTSDYALGSQSVKVVTKNDNSPAAIQKTGQSINATGMNLRLWFKISNLAQIIWLIVYAVDDTLTNYYQWTVLDNGGDGQWIAKDGLETTARLSTQYATANFQKIMDYIAAKVDMPVLTMADALAKMA